MKSICSFDNCVKKSAECGCQMSLLLVCFASRTPREFEVNQLKRLWVAKNVSFVVQFCFQILNGTTSKRLSKGVFYQVKNIYCTDNYFHDIIRVYIWRKNWTWLLNSKHKSITKLVIWGWPVERLQHTPGIVAFTPLAFYCLKLAVLFVLAGRKEKKSFSSVSARTGKWLFSTPRQIILFLVISVVFNWFFLPWKLFCR